MKKILGLDLGTTSIGWAFVTEAENDNEQSTIERIGVRVNPLTTDEQTNFEKGKPVSVNADRTLKRGARRNLQRYKQRRQNLINVLLKHNIISNDTVLAENDKNTTHSTYELRAKAASEEISKEDFARILLLINKKRGYKSSRKAKNEDEGQAIDGMAIAKRMYDENLTPGQLCYILLAEGKKTLPDFYRSDLNTELDKIWNFQKKIHTEILTDEFKKLIEGKGQKATSATFWGKYAFNTADIKGTREEKKLKAYEWRSKAINTPLAKEEVAYVITEINSNINNSSGYLGAISDRSKELFFNKETVGQYLYKQLKENKHTRLKNQVFYRQDYMDEFETIWQTQAKYHAALSPSLKEEIRDIVIFYQRKLKSQKSLVSFCEFESKKEINPDTGKTITEGYKVVPKSSPLFQEFKIWQNLNSLEAQNKRTKEKSQFDTDAKQKLFNELNLKGNLSKDTIFTILGYEPKDYELNYSVIEGNRTNQVLYTAYLKIIEQEGYDVKEILKIKGDKDDFKLNEVTISVAEIKDCVFKIFTALEINTDILNFNAQIEGKAFEKQASYQLWHTLYAYEGDNSASGNEHLFKILKEKFGFHLSHAKILANVPLSDDYGSLSAKAIRKIFPYIIESKYSEACRLAGYNHSSYLTKEENDNRPLKDKLELLPKNSLRNPVVEKILNQMVNVVNAILQEPSLGKPDEIRIELARELKKNAKEREAMTSQINVANAEHEKIRQIIIADFNNVKNPSRNDIIRYKLYEELKFNGYKNLYTNEKIEYPELFSKKYDIDHIIPQQTLFDDSFSNKTLVPRQVNLDKGNKTAYDFILSKYGQDALTEYENRVKSLHDFYIKDKAAIKAKYKKLLMKSSDIGQGFIERDLRDTQYIAKKAKQMLFGICRTVVSTSGSVTTRLREDWGLVNVMQELNIEKYRKSGLTEIIEKKDGGTKERIVDWTKRNDHRHHAMDALTIAFTKHAHIQYLNNLNAKNKEDEKGKAIIAIEKKETAFVIDDNGNKKRKFKSPLTNFREEAKKHLENVLVSCKAKNKVVTKNKNTYKTKTGEKTKTELTPRGQLHKETVYGSSKQYVIKEEKVSSKFDLQTIAKVTSAKHRNALLQRLNQYDNDPKKAFSGKNSIDKNPIYLDEAHTQLLPEKVKLVWLENNYTIRKDISPENFKDAKSIEKVTDIGIRNTLLDRLSEYKGNAKEAFSNLDKNPIYLSKQDGIVIKRVTITGVSNAEALHYKKDHLGKLLLDSNGNKIPTDFVSTGNNHHVAIYRDADGILQESVVSFYEAVERVNQGLTIINKSLNQDLGWQFLFTMKQNEYFVFPNNDFDPESIELTNSTNYTVISPNLFRVQKIATKNYFFRHHLETSVDEIKELKGITYKPQLGLNGILNIVKVRINHIGQIVKIGEY
jgi:CRISPR-associated endonuclease Csn1